MRNKIDLYSAELIRNAVMCFLLVCASLCGGRTKAQERVDSAEVLFRKSQSSIDLTMGNNAEEMQRLKDRLTPTSDSLYRIKRLHVLGGASPEGSAVYNRMLSEKRARSLFDYLRNYTSLPDSVTEFGYTGRDWKRLHSLIKADKNVPAREEVLVVISPAVEAEDVSAELSDRTLSRLKRLRNGAPYEYLSSNLFPKLRASRIYVTYEYPDKPIVPMVLSADLHLNAPGRVFIDGDSFPPVGLTDRKITYANWALKTNLLYDAALMPNLELEWLFHRLWSINVEGNVAWWSHSSTSKFYRIAEGDVELRRWINPREPWHGLYVGIFAGGGAYDLCGGYTGYQGEGVMSGLSVGYMWPLSRCFSMEAELGAGYLFSRYKEYKPFEGHYLYQTTKELNYFGPLKLKLSLVWRILRTQKVKQIQSGI